MLPHRKWKDRVPLAVALIVAVLVLYLALWLTPFIGTRLEVADLEQWVEWSEEREDACIQCLSEHDLSGRPGDYDNLTPFSLKVCPDCGPLEMR